MWTGAAAALYLLVLCLTGCIVLFERDLYRLLSPDPALEAALVARLSEGALISIALTRAPEHRPVAVLEKKISADVIVEIWLEGQAGLHRRLLNPYTGADLGAAQPASLRTLAITRQLHTNLMLGNAGRMLNGVAAFLLTFLAASAAVSWIVRRSNRDINRPGMDNVRSYHRRVGLWTVPLAALFGGTGLILSTPLWFGAGVVEWAYTLHVGVAGGWVAKAALAACALLMSILMLAGIWTWAGQSRRSKRQRQFFGPPSASSAADIDFPSGSTMTRAAATKGSDFDR
jgi:uncharacterized iron-regulated membrane protein